MALLNPYLNFNGQCREALTFYRECLDGELSLQKVSESPMAARMPSGKGAHILHGALTRNGTVLLMGSDMIGNNLQPGNSVNLCLNCTSDEEINTLFNRLSAGGQIKLPLHQSFWGATYAEVTDKFGISWMLNYTKENSLLTS
ncbi:MAG TPA: VOC family protein [Puia sp.]|jgi:PhnB protein|nr:VOC family protein [Puia sp.]